MSEVPIPSPDETPSTDPGDDTQRRFRYQASCAALLALELLDEESEFEEIYCEQHEDILIRRKDGKFVGRQVKTRELHLGPFKTFDDAMIKSLTRFTILERDFPERFAHYGIATNNEFFKKKGDRNDFQYLIDLARDSSMNPSQHLPKHLKPLIETITEETGCTKKIILSALSKIELNGSLHALDDCDTRVLSRLIGMPELAGCSLDDSSRVARALIETTFRAASLANDTPTRDYLDVVEGGAAALIRERIENKRLTKASIKAVITSAISGDLTFTTPMQTSIQTLSKGVRKLEIKMGHGGISLQNILLAKDLKASTEMLLQMWYHRYGPERAEKMYKHLRTLVFAGCQASYDSTFVDRDIFGTRMLVAVRLALKDKRIADNGLPQHCTEDHFFGMAAILTEDCIVWWSKQFEIPSEGNK
jgi:hypothetical protein